MPWGALGYGKVLGVNAAISLSTCTLTCMQALIYRWIGGIVGGQVQHQYAKLNMLEDVECLGKEQMVGCDNTHLPDVETPFKLTNVHVN